MSHIESAIDTLSQFQNLGMQISIDDFGSGYTSLGYLKKLPNDPWGKPYQYLNPGVHSSIDVFSYGADGADGGDGENADIGNWTIE